MKIVQINACYEVGSTGRMAKEMHEYFLKEGLESFVFSPNVEDKSPNIINIGNRIDYKLHSLLSRIFGLQGFFSVLSTFLLVKKLKSIKPDIVHLHNLHNNYINLPILFKYLKDSRIATVITLHDFWFMTGHCGYFTEDSCERWRASCGNCPALRKYNPSWLFDTSSFVLRQKKQQLLSLDKLAIIGNSKWTTAQAERSFLANATLLSTVYNWIDSEKFYPRDKISCRQKHGFETDDYIIIGVAQGWNNVKGLNVFEFIARKLPQFKIILVGEMLDNRPLPSNITCVGTVRNPDILAEYYSLADVYCNPSVQETFGLVTAEAISCGTPVVANNETATPELVLDGCGYIVEHNNIDQYIERLTRLSKEKYDSEKLHGIASDFFGSQNIGKYVEIYKRLLKK